MDLFIGGKVSGGMEHAVGQSTNLAASAYFLVGPRLGDVEEQQWSVGLNTGVGFQLVTQPIVEPFLSVPLQFYGKLHKLVASDVGLIIQADYNLHTGEIAGGGCRSLYWSRQFRT